MDTNTATAAKVTAAFASAGITRRELSLASGIPYTSLYRKLHAQSPFTVPEISAVARVLNVEPDSLIEFGVSA